MKVLKILFIMLFTINLFAKHIKFDSLVKNEAYFKNAIELSKQSNYGENRIIAILDTGINSNNAELKDKVIAKYDFTTNSSNVKDTDGHGTKMASVIASANDGVGITGIAYNSKLIDAKIVNNDGKIEDENIIKAIDFAVKNSADVINMSFSSGKYSKELEETISKYAKQGIVFVASAGNDGENTITYPAGYKNVIAVSSLNRHKKTRAKYANYGNHIDEYIEDGIWTYDGKKYSREYGTSEASAVVSSYVLKGKNKNIINTDVLVDDSYNLAEVPTVENISFDALLESNDGTSYLNSLIQYILIQQKMNEIFDKLNNKVEIWNLDTRYSHSASKDFIKKASELNWDLQARLFLFDMFGRYAEIMISDYNKEDLLEESKVDSIFTMIDETIKILDGTKFVADKLVEFNKKIKKIVLSTEGKKDVISKMIRKYVRIFAGDLNSKSITAFKAKNLAKNLDRANKAIKGLELLKKGLLIAKNIGKNLSDNIKQQEYMKVYALDFVLSIQYMKENGGFNNSTSLNKSIISLLSGVTTDTVKLEEFVDRIKYMGFYTAGIEIAGDAVSKVTDKFLETDSKNLFSLSGMGKEVLKNIIRGDLGEAKSIYKYNLYRNFLSGVNKNAITLQNKEDLGFISSKYIITNIMTNMAIRELTYHGYVYLKSIFSNQQNWGNVHPTIIIESLNDHKLTRDGSKYNFTAPDTKQFVVKHIVSSLSIIPSFFFGKVYELKEPEVHNLKDYGYWNETSENSKKKLQGVALIFGTDFNNFMYVMAMYQKKLLDMCSASYVYDLVSFQNKEESSQAKEIAQIEADIDISAKKVNYEFPSIGAKNDFRNSIIKFYNSGVSYIPKDYFTNINKPINRKDFLIMSMISLINEFNPFGDVKFLKKLATNNLDKNFPDLVGLTTIEKLWILYGADKGLINGFQDGTLHPNDNIVRKDAFAFYGGLIKKSKFMNNKKLYTNQNTHDLLAKPINIESLKYKVKYNLVDYDKTRLADFRKECSLSGTFQTLEEIESLNKTQADNIKTAYLNDIFGGSVVYHKSLHNEYVQSKLMDLSGNLSHYGASVVSNRLFNMYNHFLIESLIESIYSKYKPQYSALLKIPITVGDTGIVEYTLDECFPSIEKVRPLNSLDVAYSNIDKKFIITTKIPKSKESQFLLDWEVPEGILKDYEKYFDKDGYVKSSIVFTPKSYDKEEIIPLKITVSNFKGQSASKIFYVNVKPYKDYNKVDNINMSTSLVVIYNKDTNKFKVSWSTKNATDIEIFYSFDRTNWNRYSKLNLSNYQGNSYEKSISGSSSKNIIYFKVVSTNGSNKITSNIVTYKYNSKIENYVNKASEKPSTPQLRSLSRTKRATNLTLFWKRVNDSNHHDNVVKYEIQYATNSYFDDAKIVNAGNNTAGSNIYENCSYTFNNLKDDTKYYFKVRAYNNYKGGTYSPWSSYESTRIDLENLPYFRDNEFYPFDKSVGISKKPTFRFEGYDADGDDLEYFVRWGESPENLNYKSGWTENYFFEVEDDEELKPNTKYYWQVQLREKGHYKDYYGGAYPITPVYSFTTTSTGSDLAITNVELISELKPDSEVKFKITVKNIGTQKAKAEHIRAYYKKNGKESKFRKNGWASIKKELNPNESITVELKTAFDDSVTSFNGITYDNVLITGDSYAVFKMPNLSTQDINPTNNIYEKKISYEDKGKPVVNYFTLSTYSYNNVSELKRLLNGTLKVTFGARDDINISKVTLEFRVNKNDSWHNIKIYSNYNRDSILENFYWIIPENMELVTNNMQIRLRVYENDTSYSEKISNVFTVFSNNLNLSINNVSTHKVGDKFTLEMNLQNDYPIATVRIKLFSNGKEEKIFYKNDENGFSFDNYQEITLPSENRYASDDAYVEVAVFDIVGNNRTVKSNTFKLEANKYLSNVFGNMINVYDKQYNYPNPVGKNSLGTIIYPPSYGIHKSTENEIKFLELDDNNVVHMIISHTGEWRYSYYNGQVDDDWFSDTKYLYLTYNIDTKQKSNPIEIFSIKRNYNESDNYPTKSIEDFKLINGIPYVISYEYAGRSAVVDGNTIKLYKKSGNSFSSQVIADSSKRLSYNRILQKGDRYFVNYIKYPTNSYKDGNYDRRNAVKEIFPNIGNEIIINLSQYLSSIRVNQNYLNSSIGKIFSIDDNFNINLVKDFGTQNKTFTTRSEIYLNNKYLNLLIDDEKNVYGVKKDFAKDKIFNLEKEFNVGYENSSSPSLYVKLYDDLGVFAYPMKDPNRPDTNSTKIYGVSLVNLETKAQYDISMGNRVSYYISKLVSMNSNKILAVGQPDEGSAYLAIGDFSKDVIEPTLSLNNTQKTIEAGGSITLNWSASDNNNAISRFEIKKVVNGVQSHIATLDKTKTSFTYIVNDSADLVELKVLAYDVSENKSEAILPLKVLKPITFYNFSFDKTDIQLGDKVNFTWSSSGSATTEYTVYKKEVDGTKWTEVFTSLGSTSKLYLVSDFTGTYKFKIVSGVNKLEVSSTLTVNGELLQFKEESFKPNGSYFGESNSIKLSWSDTLVNSTVPYSVYIKQQEDSEFTLVGTTANRYFEYQSNGKSFIWKVTAPFDSEIISSNEINVNIKEITAPTLNGAVLSGNNDSLKIDLSFTKVQDVNEYIVLREYNGSYKELATITTNRYIDENIQYGSTYTYKIVSKVDSIKSDGSNTKTVEVRYDDNYSVILDTENYQSLETNSITLQYHPSATPQYEAYKILIGTNPSSLSTYKVTTNRSEILSNLDYSSSYYVEIYSVDMDGNNIINVPARLTFSTGFDKRVITDLPFVSIDEIGEDYISLSWNKVTNADSYYILRSENDSDLYFISSTVETSFKDVINLKQNVNYKYKVYARNSNSNQASAYSQTVKLIAPDTDKDGIRDDKDSDDDNDGISDEDELKYGLDPLDSSDAAKDSDNDGVSNIDEIKKGTNPTNPYSKIFTLNLNSGWNLVSLELNSNLSLSSANNEYIQIVKLLQNSNWKTWSKGSSSNTLSTLEDGYAYWIKSSQNTSIELKADAKADKKTITAKQWNMIGSLNIDDIDKFFTDNPNIKIIWKYKDGVYQAISNDPYISSDLDAKGIEKVTDIKGNEGIFVK